MNLRDVRAYAHAMADYRAFLSAADGNISSQPADFAAILVLSPYWSNVTPLTDDMLTARYLRLRYPAPDRAQRAA